MNIKQQTITLVVGDKSAVIPVDIPTVLKADAHSNKICSNANKSPSINRISQKPMNNKNK
jgi:hypothetical protein